MKPTASLESACFLARRNQIALHRAHCTPERKCRRGGHILNPQRNRIHCQYRTTEAADIPVRQS